MALDGAFLACLREELSQALFDARIDKIHQPGKDELVMHLRCRQGVHKVYISAGANAPRIHLIADAPENPPQPPMFCMLLRKQLTGGRLVAIRQPGLERVLYLDFDCTNDLGDRVRLTLAVEIMGRHSNIILIRGDGTIVDAIKRVDPAMSSVRLVLPGIPYELPPAPAKRLDLSRHAPADITEAVRQSGHASLSQALLAVSQGLSPLTCREIAYRTSGDIDSPVHTLTEADWQRLETCLTQTRQAVLDSTGRTPYLVTRPDGTPLEYSFQPITQYGLDARGQACDSFSSLLDAFYAQRAAAERMKVRSQDLSRVLTNATERVRRKVGHQKEERAAAAGRDTWRLYADLIQTQLHAITPGAAAAELINYYDEACAPITVPLDPALSAAANAQKYYKEYRKAQTAERVLQKHIAAGEQELVYLDSVAEALSRASTTRDIEELRTELEEQGYLRRQKSQKKSLRACQPQTFLSDDGFVLLVGRNNTDNDRLTLHTAQKHDVWLHTKNIPGSHVIVVTEGQTPPDRTIEQAAILAATYSKARDSVQVPVDYAPVRYVKKPAGAKPGMVIYTNNRTAYVNPDPALAKRLQRE